MGLLNKLSYIVPLTTSLLLVLLYTTSLVQVLTGSKYLFVVKLLVLLLVCSISTIVINVAYYELDYEGS